MQPGCCSIRVRHVARTVTQFQAPNAPRCVRLSAAPVAVLGQVAAFPAARCSVASRSCWRPLVPGRDRHGGGTSVTAATPIARGASTASDQRREAKQKLLQQIAGTDRGSAASSWQRALVAEAQVDVESCGSCGIARLEGLWRLIWTTADDVRPLVGTSLSPFSLVQVGNIYQKFSSPEEGRVQNIIQLSFAGLTVSDRGATFTVDATYDVRSDSRIALVFEAASLGEVRISSGLEAALAPALLPRTWVTQQLLLALKQLDIRVPLTTPSQMQRQGCGSGSSGRSRGFGEYLLSYIDDDMLIGRASQGCFIFQREP